MLANNTVMPIQTIECLNQMSTHWEQRYRNEFELSRILHWKTISYEMEPKRKFVYIMWIWFQVKLAEDTLARGSMTCSLNQLLQSHLSTPQPLTSALRRMSNVAASPLGLQGDEVSYSGVTMLGQNAATGLANSNMHIKTGVASEAVSCVSGIWPRN